MSANLCPYNEMPGFGENALEEMLILANTTEASVMTGRLEPTVKIEQFFGENHAEAFVPIGSGNPVVETMEPLENAGEFMEKHEQIVVVKISTDPVGENDGIHGAQFWTNASNSLQEMTEQMESPESEPDEQQASTSTASSEASPPPPPPVVNGTRKRRATSEGKDTVTSTQVEAGKISLKAGGKRRAKQIVPDELKDTEYWERREKNNRAARRSRRAKRLSESRNRLNELMEENERLMEQVLANRIAVEQFKRNILSLGLDPRAL